MGTRSLNVVQGKEKRTCFNMKIATIGVCFLLLGTALATPPFLKEATCDSLKCCEATTTVAATTTTDGNSPTDLTSAASTASAASTTSTASTSTSNEPTTTTTKPASTTKTTATTSTTTTPTTTTTTTTTTTPPTTPKPDNGGRSGDTTTSAPTCKDLDCVCDGSNQIISSLAALALAFVLGFLL